MSILDLDAARAALKNILNTSPDPLTRAQFDKLTPRDQGAFCRHGGKIVSGASPEQTPRLAILNQSQFTKLSAKDRSDYSRFGGVVRSDNTPAPTPRPAPAKSKPEPIDFND